MTYPGHWGAVTADKAAIIMGESGETISHGELDRRSNQLAGWLHDAGLRAGDHLALFMENSPRFHEVVWAGLRSGLVVTTVNRYLTAEEAGYIVDDCDAQALVTSSRLSDSALGIPALAPRCCIRLMVGEPVEGYDSYDELLAGAPTAPLAEEPLGDLMLYSSGTTGRPKGIKRPPTGGSVRDGLPLARLLGDLFGFSDRTVYLSPAPLYHSAPLAYTTAVQALGGTTVIMEHFDPEGSLAAIERHRVTASQWVPTMFSRMLKLPSATRQAYDLSSHTMAIHAAAPCPRTVKEAMFDWWGPILHEYYSGTELNGVTYCGPGDWLAHPGTVGRPVIGSLRICDDAGLEVPTGEIGTVYFEMAVPPFEYHKDAGQTKATRHPVHPNWTTLCDVGRVDEDGYLYLSDRKSFMIISGGVNIYPQEVENCLIAHDKVADVAVFGVPNEDLGEEVKAVVEPRAGTEAGPDLAAELISFARERLSHYKCPRTVDFVDTLPRLPTGKLYKRLLRDPYWAATGDRRI